MKVTIDTSGVSTGLVPFLSGFKTYGVLIGAAGYVGWCKYHHTEPDLSVLALFGIPTLAAFRSAIGSAVAQIVNSNVYPSSPAAQATAAEASTPATVASAAAPEHTAAGVPIVRASQHT